MARLLPDPRWGPAERAWLTTAAARAGHTQERCAEELRSQFGVAGASQVQVSRWMSGLTQTPGCIDALIEYCQAYDPRPSQASDGLQPVSGRTFSGVESAEHEEQPDSTPPVAVLVAQLEEERARSVRLAQQVEKLGHELRMALLQGSQSSSSP